MKLPGDVECHTAACHTVQGCTVCGPGLRHGPQTDSQHSQFLHHNVDKEDVAGLGVGNHGWLLLHAYNSKWPEMCGMSQAGATPWPDGLNPASIWRIAA